jgi:large subunit ribosomal protein L9
MKVIFRHDVSGVATRNEVKDVSDGYALNYLLPRGLAVQATPEGLAAVAQAGERKQRDQAKALAQAQGFLSQLQGKVVVLTARAAPSGTLYAGVTLERLCDAIQTATKVPLNETQLVLPTHLKVVGDYPISIKLHGGLVAKLTVRLQAS